MPTKTGIFTEEEAAQGHLFSYRLAQYMGMILDKTNYVYDFGCGQASYLRYLEDIGFSNIKGIEGSKINFEIGSNKIIPFDLTEKIKVGLEGDVICIEVGEHIPSEFEEVFIDNLCNAVREDGILILSWAHEGQDGYGHVNCKPDWWVKEQFKKRGLEEVIELTNAARNRIEGHVAYLKENLFVFKKI